jgi:hypothetical protein
MNRTDAPFRLDRERLRAYLTEEHKSEPRLEIGGPGGVAGAIDTRVSDAYDAGALSGPENVELETYAVDDALVVAVREDQVDPGNPAYRRQVATYSIESRYLSDPDTSETACFTAIEAVLARADRLVPTLRLLQDAERAATGTDDTR